MTINLGTVRPGSTLVIPFSTYSSDDPSKSIVVTELDTGAISVFKGTGTTPRSSASGETVDIDVNAIVGTHWITLNLADNSDAAFYQAGSRYTVILGGLVIDAATAMSNAVATFDIGYPNAIINTACGTVTSQTVFVLDAGPAEADVLIGCKLLFHDVASAVQIAYAYVTDYAVTTKTVTCTDPVGFTFVENDNVSVFLPDNVHAVQGTTQTALDINDILTDTAVIGAAGAGLTESGGTGDQLTAINLPNQTMDITGSITGNLSGSVGSVTGAVGSVGGNVDGNVTGSVGSNLELGPAEVNTEVDNALDTAIAELGVAAPTATPTVRTALMLMYMALRNLTIVQTSGTDALEIHNDAGTKITQKLLTDDGSDYNEAKMG